MITFSVPMLVAAGIGCTVLGLALAIGLLAIVTRENDSAARGEV